MKEKTVDIPEFAPDPQQEAERKLAILDSGARREFDSGAVRDIGEGKGRCDLLPFDVLACVDASRSSTWLAFAAFLHDRNPDKLLDQLRLFILGRWDCYPDALLDLARHYENGAKKYAERNWERGIPAHCFLDSAIRHWLKFRRGDKDEPHDLAFVWNLFGLLWTCENKPELDDLPLYAHD